MMFIEQSFLLSGERLSMLQFILISVWQYLHFFFKLLAELVGFVFVNFFKLTTPFCFKKFQCTGLACSLQPSKEPLRN